MVFASRKDNCLSDYELLMIVLAIVSLVVLKDANKK